MKARQNRRTQRVSPPAVAVAQAAPASFDAELQELRRIGQKLDELQVNMPGVVGFDMIASKLDRIEQRLDNIDAAASKKGAVAGAVAGGIVGGLVSTTIMLIKARVGL